MSPWRSWTRRCRRAKDAHKCSKLGSGYTESEGQVVQNGWKWSRTLRCGANIWRSGCRGQERIEFESLRPRASAARWGMQCIRLLRYHHRPPRSPSPPHRPPAWRRPSRRCAPHLWKSRRHQHRSPAPCPSQRGRERHQFEPACGAADWRMVPARTMSRVDCSTTPVVCVSESTVGPSSGRSVGGLTSHVSSGRQMGRQCNRLAKRCSRTTVSDFEQKRDGPKEVKQQEWAARQCYDSSQKTGKERKGQEKKRDAQQETQ
ncbi:hypothetical protein EDB92DRAFT_1856623 [Lactarius akahatsu]|uniref:Uncharacterized protein n=1 Tax=Lactarius akahatsu TaxID=416441 RepID=A0AAD4LLC3_9AGAM|nr:hypothetical protein EDB92DRAFT_1856623 [Lactarius akahatsu]